VTHSIEPVSSRTGRRTRWRCDALVATGIGLGLRLAVVGWASGRFPPAGDGKFYQVVAGRIARGLGYTWAWPNGAVTYAAHYPVGYPAGLGALYALLGPHLAAALVFNAVLGALAVYSVHRLVALTESRGAALTAGLLVALHPTLVAYTPALMTEGVAATLATVCAWLAARHASGTRRRMIARVIALGLLMGGATLVRPQLVLVAPLFGALAGWWSCERRGRLAVNIAGTSIAVTALAVITCLPWTARNCARMGRCVFVSANGGWNLLIGAHERAHGSWVALEKLGVPQACQEVYGEAEKDVCFGAAALARIREHPLRWMSLVPAKLRATFDEVGAPGWYLNESNPREFGDAGRKALAVAEVLWQRVLLLLCLAVLASWPGPFARLRRVLGWTGAYFVLGVSGVVLALGAAGAVALSRAAVTLQYGYRRQSRAVMLGLSAGMLALAVGVVPLTFWLSWQVRQRGLGVPQGTWGALWTGLWAWCAYLVLVVQAVLLGRTLRAHRSAAVLAALVAVTLVTHAVFFGAARYAMVCFPLMAAVGGCVMQVSCKGQGLAPASDSARQDEGLLTGEAPAGDTLTS
jgi:4-amino-4-deoxy-L-arabinose transferase-like glycosyltransferase